MGWEICWDLPFHQLTSVLPSCAAPLTSPSLQMSNATHALPSSTAPGMVARLASVPPSPALTLLTAAHNDSQDDQQLFLTTTAAQVISGIFVWSALIVTFHQVRAGVGTGLSAGVDARAKLLIAPKFIANHLAPDKYFLLLLPRGAISRVGSLVLAAREVGLCPHAPRMAARARRDCRALALPGGNT